MEWKLGLILLLETGVMGLLLYGFRKEQTLVSLERALGKAMRKKCRRFSRRRERARIAKLNRRAVYVPMKPGSTPGATHSDAA